MKEVKLYGRVVGRKKLIAPIAGAVCVLYQVKLSWLQRFYDLAFGTGNEAAYKSAFCSTLFAIHWESTQVWIDPHRARVRWPKKRNVWVTLDRDPDSNQRVLELCKLLGRSKIGRGVYCCEWFLAHGQAITVVGKLDLKVMPHGQLGGYREPPRLWLMQAEEIFL